MKLSIKKALSLALACAVTLTSIGAADVASAAKKMKQAANIPQQSLTIQADDEKAVDASVVVTGVAVTGSALTCKYDAAYATSISTASAVVTSKDAITVIVTATKGAVAVSNAAVNVFSNNTTVASVLVTVLAAPEKETVKKTKSITAAKSSVIIAPGKSKKVQYTVTKAAAADTFKAVSFTSSNEKVVKVSKVAGKKKVKLEVPSTATKGATAKVTLKSGTKKATIKVAVRNKAKKVKPVSKTVTVNKGNKVKITLTVKAQNNDKVVTDAVTTKISKTKIAKVTKTATKKGKVVVTVKGKKVAGTGKLTVKVGSKSATVNLNVK